MVLTNCALPAFSDMVKECKRPCFVLLKKITEEEIVKYAGSNPWIVKTSSFDGAHLEIKKRFKKAADRKMKQCKWCGTKFHPENIRDILCIICKDTVNAVSVSGLPAKRKTPSKDISPPSAKRKRNNSKSKTMNKVLKTLTKNGEQRLSYCEKAAVEKYFKLCKSSDASSNSKSFESNCNYGLGSEISVKYNAKKNLKSKKSTNISVKKSKSMEGLEKACKTKLAAPKAKSKRKPKTCNIAEIHNHIQPTHSILPEITSNITNETAYNLQNVSVGLDAFSLLSIIDLETNPRVTLLRYIELINNQVKELSKDKRKCAEYQKALIIKDVYKLAKKWQTRFGSFARISEHFLKDKENLPIKKKQIEKDDEKRLSYKSLENAFFTNEPHCIISKVSAVLPDNMVNSKKPGHRNFDFPDANESANLKAQVHMISDQLKSAGVDCTEPIPGIAAASLNNSLVPSNISRNVDSSPKTRAIPESSASHIDDRGLTPVQIERENMESVNSQFSYCVSNSTTPKLSASTSVSQSPGSGPSLMSPTSSQGLTQTNIFQHVTTQANMSPVADRQSLTVRNSSAMSRQCVASDVSLRSIQPRLNTVSNKQQNTNIGIMPQNRMVSQLNNLNSPIFKSGINTFSTNNYINYSNNSLQILKSVNYQSQGSPNRSVLFKTKLNSPKILLNLVTKPLSQPLKINGNANINLPFPSAQQVADQVFSQKQPEQQKKQQQQQVLQIIDQVYNAQEVYVSNNLILQQTIINPAIPQQSTNQYIKNQTSGMASSSLEEGTVVLNSAFLPSNCVQNNKVYSFANNVAPSYQPNQITQPSETAPAQQESTPVPISAEEKKNNKQSIAEKVIAGMFCEVCSKVATLRCKLCAKVAYCNQDCANAYWNMKHKMECTAL